VWSVRKACDQLDEATTATRHGEAANAAATAAPSSRHRAGIGDGGSNGRPESAKRLRPPLKEITRRP